MVNASLGGSKKVCNIIRINKRPKHTRNNIGWVKLNIGYNGSSHVQTHFFLILTLTHISNLIGKKNDWFIHYLKEKYKKDPSLKDRISKINSKPVLLKDTSYIIIKEFKGVRALSKYLNCCHKTVNKALKNDSILKKNYRVKYTNQI